MCLRQVCTILFITFAAGRSHPFFGADEGKIRFGSFESRSQRVPRVEETTPAFQYLTSLNTTTITVIWDNQSNRDHVWTNLLFDLRKTLNLPVQSVQGDIQKWVRQWDLRTQALTAELDRNKVSKWRSNKVTTKLGLAIPIAAGSLWRTLMVIESLKYLEVTPHKIALAIANVGSKDDYVQLAGFQEVLERSGLRASLPANVQLTVLYHDCTQFQWANRLIAGRYVESEYLTFFDNDDFLQPNRFAVIEKMLQSRPEIDLLLTQYYGAWQTETFEQIATVVASHANRNVYPDEAFHSTYDVAEYHDVFATVHMPSVLKWRLGSVAYEPFLHLKGLANMLIAVDESTLSSRKPLSPTLYRTIQDELSWLREVQRNQMALGRTAGDGPAAEGWPTIRSQLLHFLPPSTAMNFAEDSQFNWRVAAAGFNYKRLKFYGGTYVIWNSLGPF